MSRPNMGLIDTKALELYFHQMANNLEAGYEQIRSRETMLGIGTAREPPVKT